MDNSEVDYENLKALIEELPGHKHLAYDLAREGLDDMIKAYGIEPVHMACAMMLTEAARGYIEGGVITEAETKRQRDVENFNLEAAKYFASPLLYCTCQNQGKCAPCIKHVQKFIKQMDATAQFVPDAFRAKYAVQTEAKRLDINDLAPKPESYCPAAFNHVHVYENASRNCKHCGKVKPTERDYIGKEDGEADRKVNGTEKT